MCVSGMVRKKERARAASRLERLRLQLVWQGVSPSFVAAGAPGAVYMARDMWGLMGGRGGCCMRGLLHAGADGWPPGAGR